MPSGGSSKQTVGYKYYLGSHIGLCHGPIDAITEIQVDKRVAWTGLVTEGTITVNAPTLFGGEKREGGVSGTIDVEMGYPAQLPNAYLHSQLGSDIPAFRGVAAVVLNQVYMGNNPYLKPWKFLAARIQVTSNGETQWRQDLAGIPRGETTLGNASFGTIGAGLNLTTVADSDAQLTFPVDTGLYEIDTTDFDAFGTLTEPDLVIGDPCENEDLFVVKTNTFGELPPPKAIHVPATSAVDVFSHHSALIVKNDPDATGDPLTKSTTNIVTPSGYTGTSVTKKIIFTVGASASDTPKTLYAGWVSFRRDGNTVEILVATTGEPTEPPSTTASGGSLYQPIVATLNIPSSAFEDWMVISSSCDIEFTGRKADIDADPEFDVIWVQHSIDWRIEFAYNKNAGTAGPREVETVKASGNLTTHWGKYFYNTSGGPREVVRVEKVVTRPHSFMDNSECLIAAIYTDSAPIDAGSLYSLYVEGSEGECINCEDMNPAHIVRECLTDNNWGMGYSESEIDSDSFTTAASTLFSEGMGISILWEKEQPLEDFIGEILRHVDAVLYVSRETGKFVLKLIREETPTLTLDETNVSEVTNARRPTINELTNSVSVVYWDATTDENASVMAHNEALRLVQGYEISTTAQYPGFTNKSVAARVAERDLKALSTPLLTCELTANREAASLNVGDVFYLDWPDLNINNTVMRVDEIGYGDGRDNSIKIVAVQDVFSTPAAATIGDQDSEWVDPISAEPDEAVATITQEAPYYPYVLTVGETQANDVLADDPDAGFLLASAGRQGNELNANVFVDSGSGYAESATTDFHPYAYLTNSISYTDSTIEVENGKDLDLIEDNTIAQIGGELVRVDSVTEDSTGAFTVTVGRGILDTVPGEHLAGAQIAFWGDYAVTDNEQYAAGEQVGVKFQPILGSTAFDVDGAAAESADFDSRAIRPYPPGNFKIDGLGYPEDYLWTGSHTLTWAHRDRLQQTDGNLYDYTEGNIGPEAGTSYIVEGVAEVSESGGEALRIGGAYQWAEGDIGLDIGSQDFVIEFDLYFDSAAEDENQWWIIGQQDIAPDLSTTDFSWRILYRYDSPFLNGRFFFQYSIDGSGQSTLILYPDTPLLQGGRWYRLRFVCRTVNTLRRIRLYVDNVLQKTTSLLSSTPFHSSSEPLRIGNIGNSTFESWDNRTMGAGNDDPWSGYVKNLRITVGESRQDGSDFDASYDERAPYPTTVCDSVNLTGCDPYFDSVVSLNTFDGDVDLDVVSTANNWTLEGATISTAPTDLTSYEEKFLEVNVGTDTSYTFDIDSGLFDSNYSEPPEGTTAIILGVKSRRDGYDSWQYPQIRLQYPGFTDSVGDSVGEIDSVGTPFDSVGDSVGDSAGGWTPEDITTALWLDASDSSTITVDGSGNVEQWNDKSGNGRNATQGTSGSRPNYDSASHGVVFDNVDDFLSIASQPFSGTSARTVIAVVDADTYGASGGAFFAATDDTTAGVGRVWDLCIESTALYVRISGNDFFTPAPSTGAKEIISAQWDSGLSSTTTCYLDGALMTRAGGSPQVIDTWTGNALIGRCPKQSDQYFDGSVHELIAFGSSVSTTDRQKLEGYLAHKWGLEANLPSGHPYKSAPP